MEQLFILCFPLFVLFLLFVFGWIDETMILKKLNKVFVYGNTVKFYIKESKVLNNLKLLSEYSVIGVKNDFVRLRNKKTGAEKDENMRMIYKYSEYCEVYDDDRIVALFTNDKHEIYLDGKKRFQDNCA